MDATPKPIPAVKIEVTQQVQSDSRDVIARGLRAFNAQHLGNYEWADLDVYVRGPDGQVVGGLIGDMALGWLAIHALWVKEDLRGSGMGTQILSAAENAAMKNGCRAAILDTLGFQAPGFYEKRGYVRVGLVEDYRGGVQRIFMRKRLDLDSASVDAGRQLM
jgi:ribosomal protein S18 acetylase RimI-like enzyme